MIALMVIIKYQVKAAMVFAHLSATSMKTTFQEGVFANLATTSSTTSAPNALQVKPMTSINVSAELNAVPIKSTTSTVANVTVLRATTLSKELALSVLLVRLMISTLKPVALFLAKESTNTIATLPNSVSAHLNMFALEVFALTALLVTTMMLTLTHADASLDLRSITVSVNLSVLLIRPTSMESASATMELLSSRDSASPLISAH